MLEVIIYMFSLAFQLSAGILLLIGNTSTKKESVVQKYYEAHRPIFVEESGELNNYEELISVAKVAWVNKFAFIYLIVGYLINIFGEPPIKKGVAFVIIAILCTIFTVIAYTVAKMKSKIYGLVNVYEYIPCEGTMITFCDDSEYNRES